MPARCGCAGTPGQPLFYAPTGALPGNTGGTTAQKSFIFMVDIDREEAV
jgi:hypothetical protein